MGADCAIGHLQKAKCRLRCRVRVAIKSDYYRGSLAYRRKRAEHSIKDRKYVAVIGVGLGSHTGMVNPVHAWPTGDQGQ